MKPSSVISMCLTLSLLSTVACSSMLSDGEPTTEATAASSQAMLPITTDENEPLFCSDCFEETSNGGGGGNGGGVNQGGPGTAGGTTGFVGGIAGYASGAATELRPEKSNTPCPPDVDCVTVLGEPRPLDDSKIRVLIVGKEKGDRVEVDLPRERGRPVRVVPPKGEIRVKCKVPGYACSVECASVGAICTPEAAHPSSAERGSGSLDHCKSGRATWTCSYHYTGGDNCTKVMPLGWPFLCTSSLP